MGVAVRPAVVERARAIVEKQAADRIADDDIAVLLVAPEPGLHQRLDIFLERFAHAFPKRLKQPLLQLAVFALRPLDS